MYNILDETIANVPLTDNVVASAKRSATILERRTSTPQVLGEKKLSSGFIFVQEFCKRKHSRTFGSELTPLLKMSGSDL